MKTQANTKPIQEKKAQKDYSRPVLKYMGTLSKLTQGIGGSYVDESTLCSAASGRIRC